MLSQPVLATSQSTSEPLAQGDSDLLLGSREQCIDGNHRAPGSSQSPGPKSRPSSTCRPVALRATASPGLPAAGYRARFPLPTRSAPASRRSSRGWLPDPGSLNEAYRAAPYVGCRDAAERHPGVAVELLDGAAARFTRRCGVPLPPPPRSARLRPAGWETVVEALAAGQRAHARCGRRAVSRCCPAARARACRSMTRPVRRLREGAPHTSRPVSPV